MAIKDELLELLRTDPHVRDTVRRELFTDDLLAMPARLDRLAAHVEALATAQLRTEERVEALAAAQQRTEERLEAMGARMDALAAAQLRTEERLEALAARVEELGAAVRQLVDVVDVVITRLDRLSDWQRGEEGRREGERYERNTVRHAGMIFGGGRDVTQQPEDLQRIQRALDPVMAREDLDEADDPFLADILWLKGERIAVVEVSRQVDQNDMERAERRAALLRSAGLPALGVVIGQGWASEEAERAAYARPVEWRVGDSASAGYREFRREPAA